MTVLVTGGCGYIGAHVVHALHKKGEKVVAVDDLSYGNPSRIGNARLYGADISSPDAAARLAQIMKDEQVDSVIHFAARKQVGESMEKPLWYYRQNIDGMINVLQAMHDSDVKKLVFSSSAATYGEPAVEVVPEDVVPMIPINPYGQTKLFGEWMARACEQPYGIRFCALRYFNVAGCGPVELEDPAILNLIPMLFDKLQQSAVLPLLRQERRVGRPQIVRKERKQVAFGGGFHTGIGGADLIAEVFHRRGHVARNHLRHIVEQRQQRGAFGIDMAAEPPVADHRQRVGDDGGIQRVFAEVFTVGAAHERPAFDVFHTQDNRKKGGTACLRHPFPFVQMFHSPSPSSDCASASLSS